MIAHRRRFHSVLVIFKTTLFLLLFVFLPSALHGDFHTNKTFLLQRPHNFYAVIEESLLARFRADYKKKDGGALQFTPIVQFSRDSDNQARYFLFNNKTHLTFGAPGSNVDIDHRYFKINETSPDNLAGTLSIRPRLQHYGLQLNYYQDLSKFIHNMSLKLSVPIVCERALLHPVMLGSASSSGTTVADYFRGVPMWQIGAADGSTITLQQPLRYGKIDHSIIATGVATVDVALEFLMTQNDKLDLALSAHLIVPTDTSPSGEWLFKPLIGTGDHWALCAELETHYKINERLWLMSDLRWSYVFPSTDRRVLGLRDPSGKLLQWGQYLLVGKVGFPYVEPAANILAHDVKTCSQNQLDALVMLSYQRAGAIVEFGYNLFVRQAESIERKSHFSDNTYALAGSNAASALLPLDQFGNPFELMGLFSSTTITNNFSLANSNNTNTIATMNPAGIDPATQTTISSSQLDVRPAQTPHIFTNGIFLAGGYAWDYKNFAVTFGGGFMVEFPFDNAALMNNSVWLKTSLFF